MKNKIKSLFNRKYMTILLIVVIAVVLYIFLQNFGQVSKVVSKIFGYLSSVILGLTIAYLINPLVNFLSKKCFKWIKRRKLAHTLSVVISIILIIALFVVLVIVIIPEVTASINALLSNIDTYMNVFKDFVSSITQRFGFIDFDVDNMMDGWDKMADRVVTLIKDNLNGIINFSVNIGSKIIGLIISFIIAVYVLLDRDNMINYTKRVCKAFMKPTSYENLATRMDHIHSVFIKYIVGEIVDAAIVFIANYIFMALFNMPYPLLISIIVAVTNLIPTFGPFIGAIPSVLLIFIINPMDAVIFIVWTIGLQFVDGYIIKPLILGDTLGLSPLLILVSVIVGGKMFGILGMLLGMPVTTIIVYIFNEQLEKREEKVKRLADSHSVAAAESLTVPEDVQQPPFDEKTDEDDSEKEAEEETDDETYENE